MAKCELCAKTVSFGKKISHSHRRSSRTWKPNIKRIKISGMRVCACTRCMRTIRNSQFA